MPIIPKVGRRSPGVMTVIGIIYLVLILGSLTMVYPFCIMLTASISTRYDYEKYNFLPWFAFDEDKQFAKFLFEKYSSQYFPIFASTYGLKANHASWRIISFDPDFVKQEPADVYQGYNEKPAVYEKIATDFYDFKATLDPREVVLYDPVEMNDRYWRYIKGLYLERADGDPQQALIELRRKAGLTVPEFRLINAQPETSWLRASWFPSTNLQYRDWTGFKSQQEQQYWCAIPTNLFWQRYLSERYGRLDRLNEKWGMTAREDEFQRLMLSPFEKLQPRHLSLAGEPAKNSMTGLYSRVDAAFEDTLWPLQKYESFWTIPFLGHTPNVDNENCKAALEHFIMYKFPKRRIKLSPEVQKKYTPQWITFVEGREKNVDTLVQHTNLEVTDFNELTVPASWPRGEYLRNMWLDFLLLKVQPDDYELVTTETQYRDFLLEKYGSLQKINEVYQASYDKASEIPLPSKIVDVYEFKTNKDQYFWHYMARNYRRVFEFLVLKGRALINTLILVGLTITATLTVNPMAAYALSRYSMKSSHRILIFFLATMAFPPGVTMIPNFLLMRSFPLWNIVAAIAAVAAVIFIRGYFFKNLPNYLTFIICAGAAGIAWLAVELGTAAGDVSLLNTYAALIVPGLANGFGIFLLKGFFDSLPRELYEAGMIDGASEFKMFRTITMPLSKPILAVIALQAFTMAYSGFMWAFIVCQKQSMWTIMVWLYQFQNQYTASEPWLVMASLVVVSVPTLLMFIFCQRIILRGIIIPTMK